MSLYINAIYNYVQHNAIRMIMIIVMIMHMNDILMLMIVMDIIPNYNYIVLFHFRGVCIHLYPPVSDVFAVC